MLSVAFGSLTCAAVVELGFGLGCLACSFLFWDFLGRFLHGRRSLLGFRLSCPSVQASVWVVAWFVFEATFPLGFMYSVQSNPPRLQVL
jgi:hypothetical protein